MSYDASDSNRCEATVNGVRMTEPALVDLLFRVFWEQTQELVTHAQCMEAAEKAAWWLIEVGRHDYIPEHPGASAVPQEMGR
jgi:hypothetical protein